MTICLLLKQQNHFHLKIEFIDCERVSYLFIHDLVYQLQVSMFLEFAELADDWECTSPDSPGIAPDAMFCEAQEPRQTPSQFRKLIRPSCSSDNDPISLRSKQVAGESSGRCVIEVQEINISSTEMEKNCARVTYSELDSIPPGTVFSSRELENHRRSLSLENSVSASLVKPKELDESLSIAKTSKSAEKMKTKVGGSNPRQNTFETICNSLSLPNVDAEDTQCSSVESEPVTSFVERRTVFGTLKSKSDEGDRIPFLSCGITSPEEHQNIKSDVALSANSSDLEDDSSVLASCHLPTYIQYRKHCKASAEENASCSTTKCDSATEKQDPNSKNYVLLDMVTNNLKVGSPKLKNPAPTSPTTESAPISSSDNSQCIEEIFRVSESKLLKPKSEVNHSFKNKMMVRILFK